MPCGDVDEEVDITVEADSNDHRRTDLVCTRSDVGGNPFEIHKLWIFLCMCGYKNTRGFKSAGRGITFKLWSEPDEWC